MLFKLKNFSIFFWAIIIVLFSACSTSDTSQERSVITLPEGADPESPIWKGIDLEPKAPVLPLTVDQQLATFQLPPGYILEPVLTDPQIEQPGAISFDEQGRLLVLELRSYMLTADADAELEPTSVISRWEDEDNDGVYETGGVFVDSLVFPRFVLPWGENAVLSMESNQDNVYKYSDTDGDGKSDLKEFFAGDFGRSGNVEHQQAFLFYGMDNWMYSTYNAFRIRWTPDGILRENTGYNRAQWGVTQDNEGKIWFQGGASGLPSYFQFPIHYGNFNVEDELAEGFKVPWGAPIFLEDFQPGMQAVRRPDGSLNEVTGSAGNDIFRGHRLPTALVGQYFYGEPVARIVRQINPIVTEGVTQLHNYYQPYKSEFLKSTDPLFRPVDMATAPDGTMYIADMYHGIIQEGQWVQKGSYLRAKIEQYQMDRVVGLGRIWRLRYAGIERDTTRPQMGIKSATQLVQDLKHPNGWWRDMAQQQLVLRRDTSVSPELIDLVRSSENHLARFHAIWTLEGLGCLNSNLIQDLFKDNDPAIRKMAIRVSETLYKAGDKSLAEDYFDLMNDSNYEVVMQAIMTANILAVPNAKSSIKSAMEKYSQRGVQVVAEQILSPAERSSFASNKFSQSEQTMIEQGHTIFEELCSTCHGAGGSGIRVGEGLMAPPLANSPRVVDHPDYLVRVLLRGMVGSIDGKNYSGRFMAPMAMESDEWVAAVASYLRTNLGNEGNLVTADFVAEVRKTTVEQKPYSFDELMLNATRQLIPRDDWKVTASHTGMARIGGTGVPYGALTFEGWTSGENQEKDMWFQIELPEPVEFTEISFRSPPERKGYGPDAPPPVPTYPAVYKIEVSESGTEWKEIIQGNCSEDNVRILFTPSHGRFLRITQTGKPKDQVPWKMESMKIFAKGVKLDS
ncbi:MAG: discoidin domain-containing protein [Saprospiraceae bacterium]|nr:discoidin domain-containing protein [Saprospiraceae bacterium]